MEGDELVGSTPIECTVIGCGRTFSRASHLKRHLIGHGGPKQYKCEVCQKEFGRGDVLKRHYLLHNSPDRVPSTTLPGTLKASKVKRTYKACLSCRTAKVRCIGPAPCSRCRSFGTACHYTDRGDSPASSAHGHGVITESSNDQDSCADSAQAQMSTATTPGPASGDQPDDRQQRTEAFQSNVSKDAEDALMNLFLVPDAMLGVQDTARTRLEQSGAESAVADLEEALTLSTNNHGRPHACSASPSLTPYVVPSTRPVNYSDSVFTQWQSGPFDISHLIWPESFSSAAANAMNCDFMESFWRDDCQDVNAQIWPPPAQGGSASFASEDRQTVQPSPHTLNSVRSSKNVPRLVEGVRTRPSSPDLRSTANEQWLGRWDLPYTHSYDHLLSMAEVENVSNNAGQTESPAQSIQLDQACQFAILELVRFAQLEVTDYHQVYVRFIRITLDTLNHFLQLFFQNMTLYIPFIHQPTYDPKTSSGLLLAAMVIIGAQWSTLKGSKSFSYVMAELLHRSFPLLCMPDNTNSRNMQMWQAQLLLTQIRYDGSQRWTEILDAFRSPGPRAFYTLHAFDSAIPLPEQTFDKSVSAEVRWRIWRSWESRKRTGLSAFLADAEWPIFLDRPSLVLPRSLKAPFPCPDDLWQASTASEWAARLEGVPVQSLYAYSVSDILDTEKDVHSIVKAARTSALAELLLVQALHLSLWSLRNSCSFGGDVFNAQYAHIRRLLWLTGGGSNEYTTHRSTTAISDPTIAAFNVFYHYAQIMTFFPLARILALAGSESSLEELRSKAEIVTYMRNNHRTCRSCVLHAAQCIRHVRDHAANQPFGLFPLFVSSLILYLYCDLSMQETAGGAIGGAQSTGQYFIDLDTICPNIIEIDWVNYGHGRPRLAGMDLMSQAAKVHILTYTISLLEECKVWGLARSLAAILGQIRTREECQAGM